MSESVAVQSLRAGTGSLVPLRSRVGSALITATVLASGVASYDAFGANVAVPAIGRHFDASVTAAQERGTYDDRDGTFRHIANPSLFE